MEDSKAQLETQDNILEGAGTKSKIGMEENRHSINQHDEDDSEGSGHFKPPDFK